MWRLGTMGFGYADWRGPFYPPGSLSGAEKIAAYAETFDAVELDSTFHATPPAERAAKWADAVPADRRATFRFTAKLCKQFTQSIDPLPTLVPLLDAHRAAMRPLREAGM